MGNCANKPVTKEGEAPPPEQTPAEEVAVESREIEVETKAEGEEKLATEEATSTKPAAEVAPPKTEETEPEKAT